jgi:hypothetical protein
MLLKFVFIFRSSGGSDHSHPLEEVIIHILWRKQSFTFFGGSDHSHPPEEAIIDILRRKEAIIHILWRK